MVIWHILSESMNDRLNARYNRILAFKINDISGGENSKVKNSIWFLLCRHNADTEKNLKICDFVFSDI